MKTLLILLLVSTSLFAQKTAPSRLVTPNIVLTTDLIVAIIKKEPIKLDEVKDAYGKSVVVKCYLDWQSERIFTVRDIGYLENNKEIGFIEIVTGEFYEKGESKFVRHTKQTFLGKYDQYVLEEELTTEQYVDMCSEYSPLEECLLEVEPWNNKLKNRRDNAAGNIKDLEAILSHSITYPEELCIFLSLRSYWLDEKTVQEFEIIEDEKK